MRDFLVVMMVLGSVPLTLANPMVGVLMWFWLSLMNPHRLAWGYAQNFRVALIVGSATLIGWMFSSDSKRPPNSPLMYLLAIFTIWVSLAAFFSIHPEFAMPRWEEDVKILLMTFVTTCIVRSRERINQLVWVIVFSLGYYGVKGGFFALATGGSYRVYGPEQSFIADNNDLALALIMTLPLMLYLLTTVKRRVVQAGLIASIGLTGVSILASYSRGALLGLAFTLGALWFRSRHRVFTGVVMAVVVVGTLMWLPSQWFDRMHTIEEYTQDESVQGRFDAWLFAFRIALDHPILGGGQLVGSDEQLFLKYVPTAPTARAAHSIYFQVLGETGFVGLAIYLALLIGSFVAAGNILRATRNRPDLAWARNLAGMLQASLVGYSVSGAFLSRSFFDLYYALVALIAVLQFVVQRETAKSVPPARASTGGPMADAKPRIAPAPSLVPVSDV